MSGSVSHIDESDSQPQAYPLLDSEKPADK
jgi:hypothetical protein